MLSAAEIVRKTSDLMLEHREEWGPLWEKYAQDIIAKRDLWREAKSKFRCPPEFGAYANVTKMIKASTTFDLRYRGQLTGWVKVREGKPVIFTVDDALANKNAEHFGWSGGSFENEWSNGKKAAEFRRYFQERAA